MDENENMVVDEEMTDAIEETNQDDVENLEVGAKETEVADPSETVEQAPAEAEKENESGQLSNSFQAEKRKERERKEEAIRKRIETESYRKGLVDAVGSVNPYTGEAINDELDVEEYLVMREIEKGGGDPIADYAKTMKRKRKEQLTAEESQGKVTRSLEEFREAHPDVDVRKLLKDERFVRFAGSRVNGGEDLNRVYDDYISFTAEAQAKAEKKAEIKAKNNQAKAKASPGSLTGGGGEAPKVTYENMSDEAFERAIAKAKSGALKKS